MAGRKQILIIVDLRRLYWTSANFWQSHENYSERNSAIHSTYLLHWAFTYKVMSLTTVTILFFSKLIAKNRFPKNHDFNNKLSTLPDKTYGRHAASTYKRMWKQDATLGSNPVTLSCSLISISFKIPPFSLLWNFVLKLLVQCKGYDSSWAVNAKEVLAAPLHPNGWIGKQAFYPWSAYSVPHSTSIDLSHTAWLKHCICTLQIFTYTTRILQNYCQISSKSIEQPMLSITATYTVLLATLLHIPWYAARPSNAALQTFQARLILTSETKNVSFTWGRRA